MKMTYAIEVDCAHCANLMEEAVKKIEGVSFAVINFMTKKMIIEFESGADINAVMQKVQKACRRIEPDCQIAL